MANLQHDGYTIIPDALSAAEVLTLREAVDARVQRERGGARNVLALPEVRGLVTHPVIRATAEQALGPACFAVRALLFDKTPEANWRVVWHQDLTIAVSSTQTVATFGPWSTKAGVPHVQPPATVLEHMVAVRIHLDSCGPDNGPVRVLPATHRGGKLNPDQITALRQQVPDVVCTVPLGGLLVMRPLLLHASSPATAPSRRRVLHLEFAAVELPSPLNWHERCSVSLTSAT